MSGFLLLFFSYRGFLSFVSSRVVNRVMRAMRRISDTVASKGRVLH
jgi:hypothetical protein